MLLCCNGMEWTTTQAIESEEAHTHIRPISAHKINQAHPAISCHKINQAQEGVRCANITSNKIWSEDTPKRSLAQGKDRREHW